MAEQIRYDHYLHGGDYNPEQWLDRPDILKKDIEYFKKAHINTVSMGMFSWAVLEPEEGRYNFDWLEEVIDNLYKEGIYTILSTPSGAQCFCGIFPMNMAENATVLCAGKNSGNG